MPFTFNVYKILAEFHRVLLGKFLRVLLDKCWFFLLDTHHPWCPGKADPHLRQECLSCCALHIWTRQDKNSSPSALVLVASSLPCLGRQFSLVLAHFATRNFTKCSFCLVSNYRASCCCVIRQGFAVLSDGSVWSKAASVFVVICTPAKELRPFNRRF